MSLSYFRTQVIKPQILSLSLKKKKKSIYSISPNKKIYTLLQRATCAVRAQLAVRWVACSVRLNLASERDRLSIRRCKVHNGAGRWHQGQQREATELSSLSVRGLCDARSSALA